MSRPEHLLRPAATQRACAAARLARRPVDRVPALPALPPAPAGPGSALPRPVGQLGCWVAWLARPSVDPTPALLAPPKARLLDPAGPASAPPRPVTAHPVGQLDICIARLGHRAMGLGPARARRANQGGRPMRRPEPLPPTAAIQPAAPSAAQPTDPVPASPPYGGHARGPAGRVCRSHPRRAR